MPPTEPYSPKHPVRIVTAASLFDGHDAAINVMRRIMQATGAEVIHLGHNRSVAEIVDAAIQEDAQGVSISSYQGGHLEYFKYMRQLLDERGARHIRIYGGGGGTIIPREIDELHAAGISRIFSPDDGRSLGLQGMINLVIEGCDYDVSETDISESGGTYLPLARRITNAELKKKVPATVGAAPARPESAIDSSTTGRAGASHTNSSKRHHPATIPVIGMTGAGGAGKSSLTDELVRRYVTDFPDKRAAIVSVDPPKRKSGGALLGDRIRFNSLKNDRVFMRSLATRGSGEELSASIREVLDIVRAEGFDLIFVETAGIGQGDSAITAVSDISVYVMTAEYGAASQLEKIDMLDYADFVVINKFSRRGSADALREVRKQYQRNRTLFNVAPDTLPVFGTNAAQFNDAGVNALYAHLVAKVNTAYDVGWESHYEPTGLRATPSQQYVIPPDRERYLSEITTACREYRAWAKEQSEIARELDALRQSVEIIGGPANENWNEYTVGVAPARHKNCSAEEGRTGATPTAAIESLQSAFNTLLPRLDPRCLELLRHWDDWSANYEHDMFSYFIRGKEVTSPNYVETLSELKVRKVARPRYSGAADRLLWRLLENVPGEFPYTAGTFPFKRQAEDPTRMFAGEGPAQRTNARFHYLAAGQPASRLSTAFDSITLYGESPGARPDIYGKIGESGVSIFTVEEAERLYAGFDLVDPKTS
nr:methylmalonyl-CoA mutase family protein [bacterium]